MSGRLGYRVDRAFIGRRSGPDERRRYGARHDQDQRPLRGELRCVATHEPSGAFRRRTPVAGQRRPTGRSSPTDLWRPVWRPASCRSSGSSARRDGIDSRGMTAVVEKAHGRRPDPADGRLPVADDPRQARRRDEEEARARGRTRARCTRASRPRSTLRSASSTLPTVTDAPVTGKAPAGLNSTGPNSAASSASRRRSCSCSSAIWRWACRCYDGRPAFPKDARWAAVALGNLALMGTVRLGQGARGPRPRGSRRRDRARRPWRRARARRRARAAVLVALPPGAIGALAGPCSAPRPARYRRRAAAVDYATWAVLSLLLALLSVALGAESAGNDHGPADRAAVLLTNLLNFALDRVLIFGESACRRWESRVLAIATLVSRIGLIILWVVSRGRVRPFVRPFASSSPARAHCTAVLRRVAGGLPAQHSNSARLLRLDRLPRLDRAAGRRQRTPGF